MKKRLLHILFWSVISAAFIGPGTITTAAAAGADYGMALIWALLFSTFATILLQEGVARVRWVTGQPIGTLIVQRFKSGPLQTSVAVLIFAAIFSGCAAYEAGNILGALSGINLVMPAPRWLIVLVITSVAFGLLWQGSISLISRTLGGIVALMGVCFLICALAIGPDLTKILQGVVPSVPQGSAYLALALIGTTVVPYNLFLGSGLHSGQNLSEMRVSLGIAIGLGGIISIAVLITGSAIVEEFSFERLRLVLNQKVGAMGGYLLAVGLGAAGLTSAVTAPFAAALTAKSLFSTPGNNSLWTERGRMFRAVWMVTLLTGFLFGIADIRPVPAIILAQSLNGLILPFVAIFLFMILNDRKLLESEHNTLLQNIGMGVILIVTLILGATSIYRAFEKVVG